MAFSSRAAGPLANPISTHKESPRSNCDVGSFLFSSPGSALPSLPRTTFYALSLGTQVHAALGRRVSGLQEVPSPKYFCSNWGPRASHTNPRSPLEVQWTFGVEMEVSFSSGREIAQGSSSVGLRKGRTFQTMAVGPQDRKSESAVDSPSGRGKKESSSSERLGESASACNGSCPCGGRRRLIASLGGLAALSQFRFEKTASAVEGPESPDYDAIRLSVHPDRPKWYEELYAFSLAKSMKEYESEIADRKRKLISSISGDVKNILEVGVGTGPNLKYYGIFPKLQQVVGVDPNQQMAKYCKESVRLAGLQGRFEFKHGVGEGIPAEDESMDAVVCTLTLCSVSDVDRTLKEVKRVLKPGGAFVFVEHVAAEAGTALRFWQGVLSPLQEWVADGCHLSRNTLQKVHAAQFGSVQSESFRVKAVSIISPHVMGVAYK